MKLNKVCYEFMIYEVKLKLKFGLTIKFIKGVPKIINKSEFVENISQNKNHFFKFTHYLPKC